MGQKISPLSLRDNFKYKIWGSINSVAKNVLLRKYLISFFHQKGVLINDLIIKTNDKALYINSTFIVSRGSSLYSKKFRQSLKNKNLNNRKKYLLKNFLTLIAKLYGVHYVYFKATRLDKKIDKKIALAIIANGNKIGLFRYLKIPAIKDLIVLSTILISGPTVNVSLINYVLAKQFTWLPKRQHKHYLSFLRNFFTALFMLDQKNNKKLFGIKMLVNGRISGKTQAHTFRFIVGSIFTQSVTKNVDFSQQTSFSRLGTFGWKMWLTRTAIL